MVICSELLVYIVLFVIVGLLFNGIWFVIGILWIVLVLVEMFGVNVGFGYLIFDMCDWFVYVELIVVIVVIGVLGFVFDGIVWGLICVLLVFGC